MNRQRETLILKSMIDLIKTDSGGYAAGGQGLELETLSRAVLKVDTTPHGENDPAALSALRLADATAKWLTEMISGRRNPAVADAWFKARAELTEEE